VKESQHFYILIIGSLISIILIGIGSLIHQFNYPQEGDWVCLSGSRSSGEDYTCSEWLWRIRDDR